MFGCLHLDGCRASVITGGGQTDLQKNMEKTCAK
nr:MAG TPA: hypothetical protein [Bacteriophage sp.]